MRSCASSPTRSTPVLPNLRTSKRCTRSWPRNSTPPVEGKSNVSGHSHFAESIEEYLEAVYRLEYEGPGVTTSGLASALGVAPASVSGMLKKLDKDGYVEYVARGEVKLTRKGLEV